MGFLDIFLLPLVALFASYLSWKWKRRRLEKMAAAIPGPPGLPIVGNALDFVGDTEHMLKLVSTFPEISLPVCKFWLGPMLFVIVTSPDDLKIVLNCSKSLGKSKLYRFFNNTVGKGLFTAPVEKWKVHRRMIAPTFSTKILEEFVPIFNRHNKIMCNHLQRKVNSKEFNMYEFMESMNIDLICETALGVDIGSQNSKKSYFSHALLRASELDYERLYKFWLHPDFIYNWYVDPKEQKQIYKQLLDFPNELISQRREEFKQMYSEGNGSMEQKESKRLKNFLDLLLEIAHQGENLTNDNIRDEVVTMMIGGSETSALTNSFCCLMLAMHPKVQERAYDEIFQIFGDSDRDVLVEDLSKLCYLEQVIKETLRRFPVGPLLLREAKEDLQLTSCIVPAEANLVIAPVITHMNKDLYPDPEKFDPERFTPENVEKMHYYSYIPFSGGPRGCIGSRYAMMSMKVTLSTILRNYELQTDYKMEDIRLRIDLLLRSVNGFPIRLKLRKQPR